MPRSYRQIADFIEFMLLNDLGTLIYGDTLFDVLVRGNEVVALAKATMAIAVTFCQEGFQAAMIYLMMS